MVQRVPGCCGANQGGCEGPIVGLWTMKIRDTVTEYEVCKAHASNFDFMKGILAGQLTGQVARKALSAFGIRPPSYMPKFEFRYLSQKELARARSKP